MNNKKIYFMGIGGTAMGNIACMLSENGYTVCGSDNRLYPPMRDTISSHNIQFFEGFSEQNLINASPDLVIVGNVISRGNTEFEWLLETKQFPFCSLAEFTGKNILHDKFNFVVSGTHGKTTTTTLLTHVLQSQEIDAGYMIGGIPIGYAAGAHLGKDKTFVIEGDEYDTALFDKRSKFIHYSPNILIINNIEFDHADIFFDIQDVKRAFFNAIKIIPRNGFAIINGDDPNILEITQNVSWTNIVRVGTEDTNDFIINNRKTYTAGSIFSITDKKSGDSKDVKVPLFGEYNCRNCAMAIIAAGFYLNPRSPLQYFASKIFENFNGIKRRQEERFYSKDVVIIEDFGHHPTAIKNTIQAIKEKYSGYEIIACFEPRSNTARTDVLRNAFETCFTGAKSVLLGHVFKKQNFTNFNELDTVVLSENLIKNGIKAIAFESNIDLLNYIIEHLKNISSPTAIVFFSNGAFDNLPTKIASYLNN